MTKRLVGIVLIVFASMLFLRIPSFKCVLPSGSILTENCRSGNRKLFSSVIWRSRNRELSLTPRGVVMGILNVTPDSFSDGGKFDKPEPAVQHALRMLDEGAQIIDIGGESTRPGASPVPPHEETKRVVPIIEELRQARPDCWISIDTRNASTARAALAAGADIVNDVTGLAGDPEMLTAVAEAGAALVIMHMKGVPQTMQTAPEYEDVVTEVREFFEQQLKRCIAMGMTTDQIVFDPGIGFGKSLEHNLQLLRNLTGLRVADRPLLLGVSRKSLFGKLVDAGVDDRLWPTVATTAWTRFDDAALIHRVHDVRENVHALRMVEAIQPFETSDP